MVSVCIRHCTECGKASVEEGFIKLYGNGQARCYPKCVEKYHRRLNKRRGQDGRFIRKRKGK